MAAKKFEASGATPQQSKLDLFLGKHTKSILVAILFIATLASFLILYLCKAPLPEQIVTGFFYLLSGFVGFFAGTSTNKND